MNEERALQKRILNIKERILKLEKERQQIEEKHRRQRESLLWSLATIFILLSIVMLLESASGFMYDLIGGVRLIAVVAFVVYPFCFLWKLVHYMAESGMPIMARLILSGVEYSEIYRMKECKEEIAKLEEMLFLLCDESEKIKKDTMPMEGFYD